MRPSMRELIEHAHLGRAESGAGPFEDPVTSAGVRQGSPEHQRALFKSRMKVRRDRYRRRGR